MLSEAFVRKFTQIARSPDPDLATTALLIARLEYPRLDASRYLVRLDEMGLAAAERLDRAPADDPVRRVETLSGYLFEEQGFAGNPDRYDDPRDNLLNAVLDRRTGIPITLALVYIEVARRAGLAVDGVNFPGHFLLRTERRDGFPDEYGAVLIVDPFHRGAILSEDDCRRLLRDHVGSRAAFDRRMLARATKLQIVARMLVNLKRIYIKMRSFPQARAVTDLLVALDPADMIELRDRGLLAYHLNDYAAALGDLEAYLHYTSKVEREPQDEDEERARIREHVKALRRRMASLN